MQSLSTVVGLEFQTLFWSCRVLVASIATELTSKAQSLPNESCVRSLLSPPPYFLLMTAYNNLEEYDDPELLRLFASLNLQDAHRHPVPLATLPPRTPSSLPPAYSAAARHTLPAVHPRTYTSTIPSSTLYHFESPTRRGYTTEWSSAGAATQGVPNASVRAFRPSRSKKTHSKKKAYVVFCGVQCGVFLSWEVTKPLVSRVRHSIFRGYSTVAEAHAAFAYAQARSWTHLANTQVTAILPSPNPSCPPHLTQKTRSMVPRSWTAAGSLFIVVYAQALECQLNTLGVSGALHVSVEGKAAALAKFRAAVARGCEVAVVSPVYTELDDHFI
ncbi:hypothetical protein B0H19DRAFT_1261104 [Mycena capillaripes]|nr:hypothetical protein B0H19DRAFT_1261104 [Mycena capillaripes]